MYIYIYIYMHNTYIHIFIHIHNTYIYIYTYTYTYTYTCVAQSRPGTGGQAVALGRPDPLPDRLAYPRGPARGDRTGTNGVITYGATAIFIFCDRDLWGTNLSQSVKLYYFCVPVSPIRQYSLLLQRPHLC